MSCGCRVGISQDAEVVIHCPRHAEASVAAPEAGEMGERQCQMSAAYRFTWPGRDESFICEAHVPKLSRMVTAMGLSLQLIRVPVTGTADDEQCRQEIR